MASLSLPSPVDGATEQVSRSPLEVVRVLAFDQPLARDYAAYVGAQGTGTIAALDGDTAPRGEVGARVSSVVVFLGTHLTSSDRRTLDDVLALVDENLIRCCCVVSNFRVHLDGRVGADEEYVRARLQRLGARVVVFRPGHVLSPHSRVGFWCRLLGNGYPLVPRRLHGCCVAGDELFAAIEAERGDTQARKSRVCTLLGPNRPWRDWLAEHRTKGIGPTCLTVVSAVLSLLLLGHIAALLFDFIARSVPRLRQWNFKTLKPASLGELLALYNKYNYLYVKIVGYNNGVNHFGQRFPLRTVVSTVNCHRIHRTGSGAVKADCGTTIRQALDFLNDSGQELYVVPNYSYVCLGTAFFVPIHGSASDYSTVADTITKAVLYDPLADRLLVANREHPAFREHLFNLHSSALVLRLYFGVKAKARYFVRKEELDNPGSDQLLAALRDDQATNVEVRKSQAGKGGVQLSRYYTEKAASPAPGLELPRDALGRLWDRLEENPLTSFLMHALTRHLAWHVELFFTPDEFATFWQTHRELPLRKMQLRYIRRDGFPHSPFRDSDCVSVDMFMFRKHRHTFEAYLQKTFSVVRANPGKHSA